MIRSMSMIRSTGKKAGDRTETGEFDVDMQIERKDRECVRTEWPRKNELLGSGAEVENVGRVFGV